MVEMGWGFGFFLIFESPAQHFAHVGIAVHMSFGAVRLGVVKSVWKW